MNNPVGSRIVLVYPGRRMEKVAVFPQSLLYVAAPLVHHGLPVEIFDCRLDSLESLDTDGVALFGITSTSGVMLQYALQVAAWCREHAPRAKIVWGGTHVSLTPRTSAAHPLVDAVVVGEGEATLLEICQRTLKGATWRGLPGVAFYDPDSGEYHKSHPRSFVNLNELPPIPYQLIRRERYAYRESRLNTSRGCPYRCSFCYNQSICGGSYRAKSADRVLAEVEELIDRFGVRQFKFDDDNFFVSRDRVRAICSGFIDRKYQLTWDTSCRLDTILKMDRETKQLLAQSGCYKLSVGVEAATQSMLDLIQKDLRREDVFASAEMEANAPIKLKTNFVLGFPGETRADVAAMLDAVERRWRCTGYRCQVFMFSPWPGTPLFRSAVEGGMDAPQTLEQWSRLKLGNADHLTFHSASHQRFIQAVFYMHLFLHKKPSIPAGGTSWIQRLCLKAVFVMASLSATVRLRFRFFRFLWFWDRLHKYISTSFEDVYYDLFSREER